MRLVGELAGGSVLVEMPRVEFDALGNKKKVARGVVAAPDSEKKVAVGVREGSLRWALMQPGILGDEAASIEVITERIFERLAMRRHSVEVGKALATQKDVAERVDKGLYQRVGGKLPPMVVVDKKKAAPVVDLEVELKPLAALDPKVMTDAALRRRIGLVKQLGRSDQAARLEFISRSAR